MGEEGRGEEWWVRRGEEKSGGEGRGEEKSGGEGRGEEKSGGEGRGEEKSGGEGRREERGGGSNENSNTCVCMNGVWAGCGQCVGSVWAGCGQGVWLGCVLARGAKLAFTETAGVGF